MQAIFETSFDAIYLVTVIIIGLFMLVKGKSKNTKLFGVMAVVLGVGDSFHLIPRAYALLTTGLEANAVFLGIGKLITSITMTIFYIILYHIWENRYNVKNTKYLTTIIYALAFTRIVLCLCPQNQWLEYYQPVSWGMYRNIPFAIMGVIIIYIFFKEAKNNKDKSFNLMWLAILLSFALYIPVVIWGTVYPLVGILMIPKTLAYVWIVFMGFNELRLKEINN